MKRLFLLFLIIAPLALLAREKANTVLIHPGEVIYAKFEQKGKKLSLVSASKEKDAQAQVILTLTPVDPAKKNSGYNLKVENKFAKELHYVAEMRSLSLKMHMPAKVFPVVAGKMAQEQLPPAIEELALFGFELEL